jgi:serine/threonine-protein kinase
MTHRIDRIGKFEIIEQLGEGSLGEVFLARDTIIGREVALKVIRRTALVPPDGEGRFLRECQAASRLNHPNLVTLHEFGEKEGILYIAMDYLPGDDLETLLRIHAFTPKEALDLLAQVCDGLGYVHQHGLLHRNLKPANVRMGRVAGRPAPKLLDCGLSRTPGSGGVAAAAHLASLCCTAPECLHGGRADGRADLFPVGVMLFEALTGCHPFAADSSEAVAQRVLNEEPDDLDPALYPEINPAIQGVLRQALAKDPARRFATAEAMAETLRAMRDPAWSPHREPQPWILKPAKPITPPERPVRSRARAAWISVLAAAAVLGGAGGYWLWNRHRAGRIMPPPLPMTVASPLQPKPPEPPPDAPVQTPAPTPTPAAPGQALAQATSPAAPAAPAAQAPPPAAASRPAQAPVPATAARPPQAPAAQAARPAAAARPKTYTTVDEAAGAAETDPQGALAYLDQALAAEPGNEQILAHRIVALYALKRYGACTKAIHEARDAGFALWPMALRQPALRRMLERDAKEEDPHLIKRKAPAPTP